MSQTDTFSDGEFEMAIAAAAFAIASLEQEVPMNQMKSVEGTGSSPTTTESRREGNIIKPPDSSWPSENSHLTGTKEEGKVAGDRFAKEAVEANQRMVEDSAAEHNNTERAMGVIRTAKKATIFTDKYQSEMSSKGFESEKEPKKTTTLFSSKKNRDKKPPESSKVEEADAWEKEEMLKIRNRYEKMNATILEWENEKKTRAEYQMGQQEGGLEERRTRALQEYRTEISWIDKIAGGSRAHIDEKRRNKESKVEKKAREMRSTGKIPHSCFCF